MERRRAAPITGSVDLGTNPGEVARVVEIPVHDQFPCEVVGVQAKPDGELGAQLISNGDSSVQLEVTLTPNEARSGQHHRGFVTFQFSDDCQIPEVKLKVVWATQLPALSTTPSALFLGTVEPGSTYSKRLVVRHTDNETQIDAATQVNVETKQVQPAVLICQISGTVPKAKGAFSKSVPLQLVVNGTPKVLTIDVTGFVED